MLSAKGTLGLVSVAGAGSAVGVPLSMNVGGAKHKKLNRISLKGCDSGEMGNLVSFGDSSVKNVCGKVNDAQNNQIGTVSEEYSDFFRENGDKKGNEGNNLYESKGTNQCIEEGLASKGAITTSDSEKVRYLGLCNSSISEAIKFIKKDTQENKELGLFICERECGVSSEEVSGVKAFNKEKEDSGKEVKFYSKK